MVYGCARVGKSCLLLQSGGRVGTLVETRGEASDTGREMGKRESDVEGGKEREREREREASGISRRKRERYRWWVLGLLEREWWDVRDGG